MSDPSVRLGAGLGELGGGVDLPGPPLPGSIRGARPRHAERRAAARGRAGSDRARPTPRPRPVGGTCRGRPGVTAGPVGDRLDQRRARRPSGRVRPRRGRRGARRRGRCRRPGSRRGRTPRPGPRRGARPRVTTSIGVYSMYRLFSQTNTTGRFQTLAMFSASWNAPMFVVPSPKNATATWSVPRICADQAAPLAMHRWAPMMAYEPIIPFDASVRCIEPPLPPRMPFSRPSSSAIAAPGSMPRGERVRVPPVGGERVVVGLHRRAEPRGDRLHARARGAWSPSPGSAGTGRGPACRTAGAPAASGTCRADVEVDLGASASDWSTGLGSRGSPQGVVVPVVDVGLSRHWRPSAPRRGTA